MEKMHRVIFAAKNEARLEQCELPALPPDQVKVKAHFTLVSTGTELAFLSGQHHEVRSGNVTFPMNAIGGYSMAGEVVEVGSRVSGWQPGTRVLAMAGHSNVAYVKAEQLIAVPDKVPSDLAGFGIVGSIALHGVRLARVAIGHTILVTGLGLIGQLTAQLSRIAGANRVLVSDPSQARVNLAVKLGADAGHKTGKVSLASRLETDLQQSFPAGIHHAIETSGSGAALDEIMECLAPEGRIALLGCPHEPVTLNLYPHFQRKELRLVGAYQPRCPKTPAPEYPWSQHINRALVLDWIASGLLKVKLLLNDVRPPEEVRELYLDLIKQDQAVAGALDWRETAP